LSGPVVAGVIADYTGTYSYAFLVAGLTLVSATIPLLLIPKLVEAESKKEKVKKLRTAQELE